MQNIAASVERLRLKFAGEQRLIFQDLSLSIPVGQKVLILGPSGSGKSTLLQVLSGIIPSFTAVPISYEQIQIAEHWGFVFQDPDTQFCMSYVDEELAFVLENRQVPRQEMESFMLNVLDQVGLKLPSIHTPISKLSQGMKQRLALAAVLLLEPHTIFLDEPSALLDPEGKNLIWDSLRNTLQSHTVVVVEHHIDGILDWFDRVIILNESGVIVADDTPSSIFLNQQQLLQQYGIWYPNIWKTYLDDKTSKPLHSIPQLNDQIIIELQQFIGLRGKQKVIEVDSAQIKQGSWIAITGPNGAGKSSFLLALAQLIDSNGSYMIDNEPIVNSNSKKKQIPNDISFVFQSPELQFIADTVLEEMLHSYKQDLSIAHKLDRKQQSQYNEHIQSLLSQFRLDMPLDRHPYECSVGQKRRLSILTAMIEERSIILLDEPTFGQDAANTFTIIERLQLLQEQGTTIIMITHDSVIASQIASEEWHIANGRLDHITINHHQENRGKTHGQSMELVHTK